MKPDTRARVSPIEDPSGDAGPLEGLALARRRWMQRWGGPLAAAALGPVRWAAAATGAATAMSASAASAATPATPAGSVWPQRTLRLLVGFPAGTTPDLSARALADALAPALGQAVIVENRPGAGGNLAAEAVARATDDHTLGVVINGNLTTARALYKALSFDPARDLRPLSLLTTSPLVLVTSTGVPEGAAFFEAARASGGRWNYASVGVGSVGHLGIELLRSRLPGLEAQHVPFSGNPQILNALIAGEVQMALVPPGLAMPQVRAARVRAVGITAGGRSVLVPELGTLADAGLSGGLSLEVWTGLVAPAGLSEAAQRRLASTVPDAVRAPVTRQRLFNAGWQAVGTSPEGFEQRVREETSRMAAVIAQRRIQVE